MTATEVVVRELPIIMTGESVRAILDGSKTQTRRVIKIQQLLSDLALPHARNVRVVDGGITFDWLGGIASIPTPCPYGKVGDRLWVREAHRYHHEQDWVVGEEDALVDQEHVRYEANLRIGMRRDNERGGVLERVTYLHDSSPIEGDPVLRIYRKRPSIHMPRWASRITLEITDVRVERLQSISEADADAEGAECPQCDGEHWRDVGGDPMECEGPLCGDATACFRLLWNSINEKRGYGWDANPWVWCLSFWRLDS